MVIDYLDLVWPSFGWTGQQSDANGLAYLRARYYAPGMGRFTQLDPFAGALALPASMNGYGYGHGAPTMYTDPSGEQYQLAAGVGALIGRSCTPIFFDRTLMLHQQFPLWKSMAGIAGPISCFLLCALYGSAVKRILSGSIFHTPCQTGHCCKQPNPSQHEGTKRRAGCLWLLDGGCLTIARCAARRS